VRRDAETPRDVLALAVAHLLALAQALALLVLLARAETDAPPVTEALTLGKEEGVVLGVGRAGVGVGEAQKVRVGVAVGQGEGALLSELVAEEGKEALPWAVAVAAVEVEGVTERETEAVGHWEKTRDAVARPLCVSPALPERDMEGQEEEERVMVLQGDMRGLPLSVAWGAVGEADVEPHLVALGVILGDFEVEGQGVAVRVTLPLVLRLRLCEEQAVEQAQAVPVGVLTVLREKEAQEEGVGETVDVGHEVPLTVPDLQAVGVTVSVLQGHVVGEPLGEAVEDGEGVDVALR